MQSTISAGHCMKLDAIYKYNFIRLRFDVGTFNVDFVVMARGCFEPAELTLRAAPPARSSG